MRNFGSEARTRGQFHIVFYVRVLDFLDHPDEAARVIRAWRDKALDVAIVFGMMVLAALLILVG